MVGIDGSEGAAAALRWAMAQARSTGAEVVAVHAYEQPSTFSFAPYPLVPDLEAWAAAERQAFEQAWCSPLAGSDVPFRTILRAGHAGSVLVEAARELEADLVVTGRRGRSTVVELFAGSVSQHLVHRAGCPVVVVPTPDPTGTQAALAAAAQA